ncbi:MAG: response regulator [Nitrospirae bacterium]|nr:response regulator [Nitrospirota bacterium]
MIPDTIRRTILCVDDEQDILNTMEDTLGDRYNIKTANNAPDALKVLQDEDIAVVISDQRMPLMTGTELLAEVHKIKPHCKKILLTGYTDINAAIDAINKGAINKYITKPWENDAIIKIVNELVEAYNADETMTNIILQTHNMVSLEKTEL